MLSLSKGWAEEEKQQMILRRVKEVEKNKRHLFN